MAARKQSKPAAPPLDMAAIKTEAERQAGMVQGLHGAMLLDEFAKAALAGLLTCNATHRDGPEGLVKQAWAYADAMMVERAARLAARNKPKDKVEGG